MQKEEENLKQLQIVVFRNIADIIEKYKIGSGGFGKVLSGLFKSLPIAIKILKQFNYSDFLREIKILKIFKHPFMASLYGVVIKKQKSNDSIETIKLVNELVKGETLDKYIKNNYIPEVQKIIHLIELATVLAFLHSQRLIHRDLKPSNIMIDQNLNIKLLDFGISKISQNYYTSTLTTGTILYMAPENFTAKKATTEDETMRSIISTKVDVWAFGCIISEIFTGSRPWSPYITDDRLIMGILYAKKNFMIPNTLKDEPLVNLVKECTEVHPRDRINMKTVRQRLLEILYEKSTSLDYNQLLNEVGSKTAFLILQKIKLYLQEYLSQNFEKITLKLKKETELQSPSETRTLSVDNSISTNTRSFDKEFSWDNRYSRETIEFGDDNLFTTSTINADDYVNSKHSLPKSKLDSKMGKMVSKKPAPQKHFYLGMNKDDKLESQDTYNTKDVLDTKDTFENKNYLKENLKNMSSKMSKSENSNFIEEKYLSPKVMKNDKLALSSNHKEKKNNLLKHNY